MEGVNVRVKLTLEGHDLPQVPALVPALPPLIACERCLTFPYVKANERASRMPQLPPSKYCYGFGMGSQGCILPFLNVALSSIRRGNSTGSDTII